MLTLGAFLLRLFSFLNTPYPLGTDGYYYVVQAEAWWSHGLHVPDSSWMLRVLGLVAHGVEPVLATKLVAAGLAAAVVPAAFALGRTLDRPGAAWWLAAWAAGSPGLTHLAAEFPKNLAVAAPFLGFCAAVLTRRWGWAVALGLLTASAHRLGAVLIVGAVAGATLGSLSRRAFGALALCGVALAGLSVLPGTLHPGEGTRITSQVVLFGGIPPFCWFPAAALHPVHQLELVGAAAAVVVGLFRLAHPVTRLVLPVLLLGIAPIWDPSSLDLGYRVSLVTPLLAAPLLATIAPRLHPALVFFALALPGLGTPRVHPPYPRYEAVIDALPRPLPRLLIAHQGLNFLYDHRTGEEAMAWAPDPWLDPAQVGRLVWGVRESEWAAYGIPRVRLDAAYSYVTEADWRALLQAAEADADDDLRERLGNWRNPSRVRPSAMLRGRATVERTEVP